MAKDDSKALARTKGEGELQPRPWRGDDHLARVDAAGEVGLDKKEEELESFTEGFKAGMTLEDQSDRSIVLRGRTVLRQRQLERSLNPTRRFLKIPEEDFRILVHDGEFELRVSGKYAEDAMPALDSARAALQVWIGGGLIGLILMQYSNALAAIAWGVALIIGGFTMRSGLVNGRSLLGARLALALAMLAQEEGMVLPPKLPSPED